MTETVLKGEGRGGRERGRGGRPALGSIKLVIITNKLQEQPLDQLATHALRQDRNDVQ